MRAIFSFENLDSTSDLNNRFAGLFKKGIYSGGKVEAIGNYSVKVGEFRAITEDGMAVLNDTDVIVALPGLKSYYIILDAHYVVDGEPVIRIEAVETTAIGNFKSAIKLARVYAGVVYQVSADDVDLIDSVGRNHYKGQFDIEEGLPEKSTLTAGDWFFVKDGNYYKIYLYNGTDDFSTFEPIDEISDTFFDHRKNIITSLSAQSDELATKGFWQIPSLKQGGLDTDKAKDDEFGSYHISVNKWFASESICKKWSYSDDTGNWNYSISSDDVTNSSDFDLFKSLGYTLIDDNVWISSYKNQRPDNENKFITQNYPLLPNLNEKYALAGNLCNVIDGSVRTYLPSKSNRFVTQKTTGIKLNVKDCADVPKLNGYYYYYLTSLSDTEVYVGNNLEQYAKYFKIIPSDDETGTFSMESGVFLLGIGDSREHATPITADNIDTRPSSLCNGRGFVYGADTEGLYLVTQIKLKQIHFYTATDIDKMDYSPNEESIYREYLNVSRLFVDNFSIGSFATANNNNIEFKNDYEDSLSISISKDTVQGSEMLTSPALVIGGYKVQGLQSTEDNSNILAVYKNADIYPIFAIKDDTIVLGTIENDELTLKGSTIKFRKDSDNEAALSVNADGDLIYTVGNEEYKVMLIK